MSDAQTGPHTLGIDIGGTGLKAAVLDPDGKMVDKRVRAPTPSPSTPPAVLDTLGGLIKPLASFDRISIGFPGCQADSLLLLLDAAGIDCSTGSACSAGVTQPSHVLTAIGASSEEARSVLRFSLGHTSTATDVTALVAALPEAVRRARAAAAYA